MCDLIARIGLGSAVYAGLGERLEPKLMTILRAARGGVVENLSIDWGVPNESTTDGFEVISSATESDIPEVPSLTSSLFDEAVIPDPEKENVDLGSNTKPVQLPPPPRIQQAPSIESLPPLYPGFRTSIFAIIKRDGNGNSAPSKVIRINGTLLDRPVQLEIPVTVVTPLQGSLGYKIKMLHVLSARALVQRFETDKRTKLASIRKAETLRIAERYGIASSETSFVAIDEENLPVDYGIVRPQSSSSDACSSFARASRSGSDAESSDGLDMLVSKLLLKFLPDIKAGMC